MSELRGGRYLKQLIILLLIFFVGTPKYTDASMVVIINQDRAAYGIHQLQENQQLDASAQLKANDLCKTNRFSHINSEGTHSWDYMRKVGYWYKYAGENLSIGYLDDLSANEAFMASPDHKANILSLNYRDVGVARCGIYLVEHFGAK